MMFWTLFFAAWVAGVIGALDGIGGGLVLIPILTLLGVDIREAIAVSAVSVVAISNSAGPVFLHRHLPNLKAVAFLELFAVAGALLGGVLAGIATRRYLFFFCAFLMFISWVALWRKWRGRPHLSSLTHPPPGRGRIFYSHCPPTAASSPTACGDGCPAARTSEALALELGPLQASHRGRAVQGERE